MKSRHPTRNSRSTRRGATLVESAFVLGTLLLLLFAMLDLSLATLRYNALSAIARCIARETVVHGEQSAPERTPWGPATMEGLCNDGSAPALAATDLLVAVDPERGDLPHRMAGRVERDRRPCGRHDSLRIRPRPPVPTRCRSLRPERRLGPAGRSLRSPSCCSEKHRNDRRDARARSSCYSRWPFRRCSAWRVSSSTVAC